MTYDHLVKHNGRYYKAGEEVTISSPVPVLTDEKAPTVACENFTKTEINRMSVEKLKEYAPTIGVEVTEKSTGSELKKEIIAKLGL